MKLEMMFIGALSFGLVFVLYLGVYAEGLVNYDVDVDTSTSFGKLSYNAKQIQEYQDNVRASLQGGTVTDEDAVDAMVRGGYAGIRNNPFSSLSIAGNATETLLQEYQFVPAPVISFILLVISILVVFAIIALIFRFRTQ